MAPLSTHSRGPSTSFSHDPEPVLVNVSKVLHPDPEAARRRLYEDIDSIPHKKIKKICCIGAGYVVRIKTSILQYTGGKYMLINIREDLLAR